MKKSSTTKKRIAVQIVTSVLVCSLIFPLVLAPTTLFWKVVLFFGLASVIFVSAPILSHLSHKELEEDKEFNEMKKRLIEALSKELKTEETKENYT